MRSLKSTISRVRRRDHAAFRPANRRGFTLVELMVTVAVAAILLTIAVPSFNRIINANRLSTAANEMVGALNVARMEAIKRNGSVQFCSNSATNNTSDTLGTACGTRAGAVYVQTSAATATQVRASVAGLTPPVVLHGNIAAIRYHGDGLAYAIGGTGPYDSTTAGAPLADLCVAALSSNNHIQINIAAGSVITTTTSTGTCP
ncbi:MAG: prepilin-type N-terminal cleavage/methylation domain-containing protein [Rhodanobacter sp.]|nr:MAG: prepilin-type N-terminal cleavage/methylation domain-containing protein [Rhodanobacter sp.]TAM13639.1 MAG: prepilin-type N-terminal cleavage/methylation domain-containing protein [Rhodanobacter sp.]TAM35607.1 MAG: prepilin-type N-terminal cleavage/methylation domain-containing protein [Rhodanobacter sp.]